MAKVTCQNVPSKREIYDLFNSFERNSKISLLDKVVVKDISKSVIFEFKDSSHALKYLEYLNAMKLKKNNIFYDMKVIYSILGHKLYLSNSSYKTKSPNKMLSPVNKKLPEKKFQTERKVESQSKSIIRPKSERKNSKKESLTKKELEFLKNKSIIKDMYLKNSTPLNISSPYLSSDEVQRIFFKKSKKAWIYKKGFNNIAINHHPENNYIRNYVNLSPGIRTLEFKHRTEDKKKWMDNNGFDLFKDRKKVQLFYDGLNKKRRFVFS